MTKRIIALFLIAVIGFGFGFAQSTHAYASADELVLELTDYEINGYYAFANDDAADVYQQPDGNQYLRLSWKGRDYSSFYFGTAGIINADGLYRIEMDLRYDDNFTTTNLFVALMNEALDQPTAWTIATGKAELDSITQAIPNSDFRHLTYDIRIDDYYSNFYKYVKIGYDSTTNHDYPIDIDNIRISKGSDMSFDETVNVDGKVGGDFENFVNSIYGGEYSIVEQNGNKCLCINGKNGQTVATKQLSADANQTREYILKMKLKKGSAFSGILSFAMPNANIASTVIDLSAVTTQWSEVSVNFKPTANTNTQANVKFILQSTNAQEGNCLYIDDIQIIRKSNGINIDAENNGDFEGAVVALKEVGWKNSYYTLNGYFENCIVEDNGNQALKLYTSNKTDTTITKSLSTDVLYKAGWYKVVLRARGGEDFYSENAGFRLQSGDQQGGYHAPEVLFDTSGVNADRWVTLEGAFYVANDSDSDWINFDIWCFLRNDNQEHKSVDNYLLIDDIRFYKAVNSVVFGENLLTIGAIEGFSATQGRVIMPKLSVDSYEYSRQLIGADFLSKYDNTTKLNENWADTDYLGTIDLDIPPVFCRVDGYWCMKFAYDGKSMVKTFSSCTYMLHLFDFTVKNSYKLSFDYKTQVDDSDIFRLAFVSNDNLDTYLIDMYAATLGDNMTGGSNTQIYTYTVSDNQDGWRHVELVFQPNIQFKKQVNSLRFLLETKFNTENEMYIANFALTEYSHQPLTALTAVHLPQDTDTRSCGLLLGVDGGLVIVGVVIVVIIAKRKGGNKDA